MGFPDGFMAQVVSGRGAGDGWPLDAQSLRRDGGWLANLVAVGIGRT